MGDRVGEHGGNGAHITFTSDYYVSMVRYEYLKSSVATTPYFTLPHHAHHLTGVAAKTCK